MIPSIYPDLTLSDFGAFLSVWKNKDEEFETEILKHFGFKYAQTYSNGRAGLFHVLQAHNIKNKKIIITAYTCCVVTEAIIQSGNTPFFIDTDEGSFNSTILENHITALGDELGAVVITNIFGIQVQQEYDFLTRRKNYIVIIDSALAPALVRSADRNSCDYVYISTGVRKPYSCLGGGIVLTDNEKLYEHLKNHTLSRRKPKNKTAQLKRFILTTMFFFGFNPVLYPFTFILRRKTNLLNSFFSETGNDIFTVNPEYFYPMARFQARIGIVQLKKINRLLETRRISGDIYFRLLEPHYDWVKTFLKPGTAYSHMPYLHPERDKLEVFLNNNSIDTERYFDYTIPDIKQYGDDGNYPRSHKIGKQILNLPMNVGLTEKKISYVVQKIIEFDKLNSKNK